MLHTHCKLRLIVSLEIVTRKSLPFIIIFLFLAIYFEFCFVLFFIVSSFSGFSLHGIPDVSAAIDHQMISGSSINGPKKAFANIFTALAFFFSFVITYYTIGLFKNPLATLFFFLPSSALFCPLYEIDRFPAIVL